MEALLPLVGALLYVLLLFGFAAWAEDGGNARLKVGLRPPTYALALAVYCTSWTFYGAVGSVVMDGWAYLPIYLGPILVFLFAHRFLVRLIEAVKADGANSISEFIGGRFNNSRGVAALVTILALLGSIPYIALQLRSLGATFALMAGESSQGSAMMIAAVGLALFAILYGTRRYEPGSRSDAILFAIGFESLFKLAALVVAGVAAVVLFTGADPLAAMRATDRLTRNFAPANIGADFFVITLLSMAAIIALPRQFYIMAIEAKRPQDIERARWPFILYLAVTVIVVLPIAGAGIALLPAATPADQFVLQLPLQQGMAALALLVFLGGFSAATAMVLVETIALATMVSNDLVAPWIVRGEQPEGVGQGDLGRALLATRRVAIAAIMAAALAWALGIPDGRQLSSIGLVAFAAMAQFAPILIMAVIRANRDAAAAKAGLIAGLVVWTYTLALPQVLSEGTLGALRALPILNPNALLGIDGLSPLAHGTVWSLGANLAAFIAVTARRVQASAIPNVLRDVGGEGAAPRVGELVPLVARFIGADAARDAFADRAADARVDRATARLAERLIAGVVGVPSARAFLGSALTGARLSPAEVARLLDETGQSLRFSKGLLAATLENIDAGVSVVDRDLNIVAWNSRYLEMFDYPVGMVRVGEPVATLIRYNALRGECGPGEVDAHVGRRLENMRRAQPHSFQRVRPDGRVLKTVGGPMPAGGYVMCFTDITAEARAITALERIRHELEARVAARTSALSAANAALAHADAEKTRFLVAASHDLLQPLHAARLFAGSLGRNATPAQQPVVEKLDRSIDAADRLLRALLDISRLDAGGVAAVPQPVALRAFLVELVETLTPLAAERGLTIRVGRGDAMVATDPGLLRSIVQNLLVNAIRHNRAGGVVVGVRRRDRRARIDVIDTGPGIAEDQHARIFREFERLSDAGEGGVGLGLAIVERTARVLGARISLRSRVGRGSRFSVHLPMTGALAEIVVPQVPETRLADRALAILVVDDDAVNGEGMASFLGELGHHVIVAATGADALAAPPVDVALVDYHLGAGEEDGLRLIERLRARMPGVRAALVTATPPGQIAARASALRVPVLRKPVAPADLERWLAGGAGAIAAE